eukprot:Nk52_evm22s207 gene=Nk52_evmTU22s207
MVIVHSVCLAVQSAQKVTPVAPACPNFTRTGTNVPVIVLQEPSPVEESVKNVPLKTVMCAQVKLCARGAKSPYFYTNTNVSRSVPPKRFRKAVPVLNVDPRVNITKAEDQDNCLQRQPSFDLDGGKCLLSCDVGQCRGPDKKCANCNEQNCAVCGNADNCSTCLPQFLLEDTKCKTNCSEGRFALGDYWDRFCKGEDEVIVTNYGGYSFWIEHVREDDQLADNSDVTV